MQHPTAYISSSNVDNWLIRINAYIIRSVFFFLTISIAIFIFPLNINTAFEPRFYSIQTFRRDGIPVIETYTSLGVTQDIDISRACQLYSQSSNTGLKPHGTLSNSSYNNQFATEPLQYTTITYHSKSTKFNTNLPEITITYPSCFDAGYVHQQLPTFNEFQKITRGQISPETPIEISFDFSPRLFTNNAINDQSLNGILATNSHFINRNGQESKYINLSLAGLLNKQIGYALLSNELGDDGIHDEITAQREYQIITAALTLSLLEHTEHYTINSNSSIDDFLFNYKKTVNIDLINQSIHAYLRSDSYIELRQDYDSYDTEFLNTFSLRINNSIEYYLGDSYMFDVETFTIIDTNDKED